MLFLPVVLASFLVFTPQIAPTEAISYISSTMVPCKKKNSLGQRDVNIRWTLCAKRPPVDSYYKKDSPRNDDSQRPKYRINEFDECNPHNDKFMSCFSNPDTPTCEDSSYPRIRQVFTTDENNVSQIVDTYSVCPEDPQDTRLVDALDEDVVRISLDQFRSFPIVPSTITSSPVKFSLRNGHTHFWASQESQDFDLVIGDSDVQIKAIPIQWNWKYGDGTTRNLNFAGEAMPDHTLHEQTATSHSYQETGTFQVGATTLYRGEFSVDGGPWQAIPGQAAVPSDPIEIDVWRTKKELIANE